MSTELSKESNQLVIDALERGKDKDKLLSKSIHGHFILSSTFDKYMQEVSAAFGGEAPNAIESRRRTYLKMWDSIYKTLAGYTSDSFLTTDEIQHVISGLSSLYDEKSWLENHPPRLSIPFLLARIAGVCNNFTCRLELYSMPDGFKRLFLYVFIPDITFHKKDYLSDIPAPYDSVKLGDIWLGLDLKGLARTRRATQSAILFPCETTKANLFGFIHPHESHILRGHRGEAPPPPRLICLGASAECRIRDYLFNNLNLLETVLTIRAVLTTFVNENMSKRHLRAWLLEPDPDRTCAECGQGALRYNRPDGPRYGGDQHRYRTCSACGKQVCGQCVHRCRVCGKFFCRSCYKEAHPRKYCSICGDRSECPNRPGDGSIRWIQCPSCHIFYHTDCLVSKALLDFRYGKETGSGGHYTKVIRGRTFKTCVACLRTALVRRGGTYYLQTKAVVERHIDNLRKRQARHRERLNPEFGADNES